MVAKQTVDKNMIGGENRLAQWVWLPLNPSFVSIAAENTD